MPSPVQRCTLVMLLAACGQPSKRDTSTEGTTGTTGPTSVLAPPIAEAGPDLVGPIGTTLFFDGTASTGTTFLWDFGDGTTADTMTAEHTYTEPGNYTAVLQVTGEDGSKRSDEARVNAHRPLAAEQAQWSAMMQISPDGSTLWAAVDDAHSVARVDTTTFAVAAAPMSSSVATAVVAATTPT